MIFLPVNSTSLLQPLDQGIIQNFKVLYRKLLIERILVEIDRERTNAFALANKFSVYDSIQMIYLAWSLVLHVTIKACFLKCGFQKIKNDAHAPVIEEHFSSLTKKQVCFLTLRLLLRT